MVIGSDGLGGANIQAAAAAVALVPVHCHLAVCIQIGGIVGADVGAGTASHALFGIHHGTAVAVHVPLAGPGAGTHAQILQCAAETGFLVALEVIQGDDDVGIHNGTADEGFLHIHAVLHGNGHFISTLQTVSNQHMGTGGVGGEAVEVGSFQMIQSVLPRAPVQGVGIGQEGLAA